MPRDKKALPSAGDHYDKIVSDPVPPDDLWEQMAAIVEPKRPANAFTSRQFMDRFNLRETTARARIRALVEAGLVEVCGTGTDRYYVWKGRKG